MPLCLSSAKRSRVATISVACAAAMSGAGGAAAAGRVPAMGPSSGLSTRPLAISGKEVTSTTPCWLVNVTVLPDPCCCETPVHLMVEGVIEPEVPVDGNGQPALHR